MPAFAVTARVTLSQESAPFSYRNVRNDEARKGREHVVKKSKFTEDQIAFALK